MKKREKIMEYVFLLAAVISIVAVALICIFLCFNLYFSIHEWNTGNEENRICGIPDRNQVEAGKQ